MSLFSNLAHSLKPSTLSSTLISSHPLANTQDVDSLAARLKAQSSPSCESNYSYEVRLPTFCTTPPTAHRAPPTAHRAPPTAHRPPPAACHLPSTHSRGSPESWLNSVFFEK